MTIGPSQVPLVAIRKKTRLKILYMLEYRSCNLRRVFSMSKVPNTFKNYPFVTIRKKFFFRGPWRSKTIGITHNYRSRHWNDRA